MSQDASRSSLTELFRSLNVAPDYKFALVRLAEQVERLEREREHQEMLSEAVEPPRGPRHKRDRSHLRLVTVFAAAVGGLLAALRAAAAWAAGRGARKAVAIAAGTAVAGGAVLTPQIASPGPGAPDIVRVRPVPSAVPVLRHHPHVRPGMGLPVMVRRRRRVTRHRHHAASAPPPQPSPSPSPSPAPSPTGLPEPAPSPSVTVTGLPGTWGGLLREPGGLLNQGVPRLIFTLGGGLL